MDDFELLYYIYQKDEEALQMLMDKHEKNVFFAVKHAMDRSNYTCVSNDELNEMLHLGRLELYEAIDKYCDDGRCSFSVFAQKCVEMGIRKYIRHRRNVCNTQYSSAFRLDGVVCEKEGIYYVDALQNRHPEFEGDLILKWYCKENLLEYLENELTEREFMIVKLKLEGYTQAEITRILPVNSKRVSYVCKKMKKLLLSYID